jgi:D-tyrosyl-tRNA(Tyr) deacylase
VIALLQRVSEASVRVQSDTIGAIGTGLLVLVGVQRGDGPAEARRLAERVLAYRVFPDGEGRMNHDVRQAQGELLVVPQFTLAADTDSGNRPSFTPAADPETGRALFERFVEEVRSRWPHVATGRFGADMAVGLVNQGPVTFWLEVAPGSVKQQ